ncbi:MAG: hypothetical protein ACJAT4_002727 [Granulosicoccus sp.]
MYGREKINGMLKKFLLVFILGTGVLSCFCDEVVPFWNVKDIEINFINDDGEIVVSDSIFADSLNVIVSFDLDYVAEVSFQNIFINSAMATQPCPSNGEEGMKDPINNMTLTADEEYNDFAAGASLNEIVRYGGEEGFGRFVITVGDFPAVSFFGFQIMEKPLNLDSVKFTLQLDFVSGDSISKESGYVFWK